MRISVYIDGFNYYHSIKNYAKLNKDKNVDEKKLKWLDYKKLVVQSLLKENEQNAEINVNFYTAINEFMSVDSQERHKIYLSALEQSGINVIKGYFKLRKTFLNGHLKCNQCSNITKITRNQIIKPVKISCCNNPTCNFEFDFSSLNYFERPEEKKTDVKIALDITNDFNMNNFDKAFLFSSDSDFIPVFEHIAKNNNDNKEFVLVAPATKFSYKKQLFCNKRLKYLKQDASEFVYKTTNYDNLIKKYRQSKIAVHRLKLGCLENYQFPLD